MTNFELWWQIQTDYRNFIDRYMARKGWEHALDKTIKQFKTLDQDPTWFYYRGSEPFSLGHNACVKHISDCFLRGEYPQI